jgi:hypothetical protein
MLDAEPVPLATEPVPSSVELDPTFEDVGETVVAP